MIGENQLLSTSEVLRMLNIPRYKLRYLFKSRKLKIEDFSTLDNKVPSDSKLKNLGFTQCDLQKIKETLFEASTNRFLPKIRRPQRSDDPYFYRRIGNRE